MIERRPIVSREQWLEDRKPHVTASTIGALFGVHPYTTALKLYVEKRGVDFFFDDNKILRRGRWMEPAVAKAVEELRPGWKLEAPNEYIFDPDLKLGATLDFRITGDPRGIGVLQAKTAAPSVYAREWDGGNEVPQWIILQAVTETMLSDAAFGAVAVLLVDPHNMDCVIHELPRHPAAEAKIKDAVKKFWEDIAQDREPEPDYGKDADVIKALYPAETPGSVLDLHGNNHVIELLDRRAWLMSRVKDDEAAIDTINAELQFLMRDHESAIGLPPGLRITYKSTARAGYSVPAKTVRSLRVFDKREQVSP